QESLLATWRGTGRATVTSAIALLMGFAILSFSSFEGFAQFGRVAVILLAATAGGFLICMPTWILLTERLRKERSWPKSLADAVASRQITKLSPRWKSAAISLRLLSLLLLPIILFSNIMYTRFDYSFEEKVKARRELPK